MHKRVMILLFVLLLLIPAVFAATTINDAAVITSGEFIGALNWTNLQSYPAPCATGSYLTAVNDTTTCVSAIPSYTNIVLSNSTLMNTTILQLTSNLSGAASAVSSYANIVLSNQSTALSQSFIIQSPGVLSAPSGSNISNIGFFTVGSKSVLTSFSSTDDLLINSTNANANVVIGTKGLDFQYTNASRFAVPRINGQITCNATSEGAIWWNTPGQVIQTCDGGGGNIRTFAYNVSSGVSYGTQVTGSAASALDGGSQGLLIRNQNVSSETTLFVTSPGNSNANTIFSVYVLGTSNNGLIGPFNQVADSILMILDGARQNRIAVSYGQNLTINIGDGAGNFASTDQVFFGADRVQISPDVLMQLKVNTTSITCNAANAGSIIYSTAKHFGCDGTTWQALY